MTTASGQKQSIVAGGGWEHCDYRLRKKAHFYSLMSVLWIFPSLGALAIFFTGDLSWRSGAGFSQKLESVPFEQWVALAILFLHPWFIALASRYRKEPPVPVAEFKGRNKDHHLNNLH